MTKALTEKAKEGHRRACKKYDLTHKKQKKRYVSSEKGRSSRKTANKKYWDSHPQKAKAHNAVSNALRDGKLERPDICESCDTEIFVEAHHEDYNKPLEVIWMCIKCHKEYHAKAGR